MNSRRSIELARPSIGLEEAQAVRDVLLSGRLTQGPKVTAFERLFAERHSTPHAVAASSGTAALHIALAALEIGPGDEVIIPAFTWVATANAVLYVGAKPIFVDVDPKTYNMDCSQVAAVLSPRTRAIIPVHLFGLCADLDSLGEVVPDDVFMIEDAACAAGAAHNGRPAGSIGDIGCFSFHPRKSITTGEGGMITLANDAVARRAAELRNHGLAVTQLESQGSSAPYDMPDVNILGFNYRMSEIQAAIGCVQLPKLDGFIRERDRWARWYMERLADIPWLKLPCVPDECAPAWQAFVTVVDDNAPFGRNQVMDRLQEAGIHTRPGTQAVSELSYYRDRLSLHKNQFPVAAWLEARAMALPLHNMLTPKDYSYVVETLHAL